MITVESTEARQAPASKHHEEMRKVDTFMLLLLLAHIPFGGFIIPYGYGTTHIGIAGTAAATVLALLGYLLLRGTVYLRILNAILLMSYSAIFVACQLGRIEMHFHFFSAMAFLVLYRDWRTLPAVVLYVGGHHGIVNYCQSIGVEIAGVPLKVFSGGAGWDMVVLHALFVVFEVSVLIYICEILHRQFIDQEKLFREVVDLRYAEKAKTMSGVAITAHNLIEGASSLALTADTMAQSTQNQAAAIEEMSASAEEVTAAMDTIYQTSTQQSATVISLIQQMEKLEKTVQHVAQRIDLAATTAAATSTVARGGEASLVEMSTSMQKIAQNARKIEDVVGLINEIADRVNLLSLNASIEAARAGEAGRGFAVVAQEISRLADQTAASTKDISALVQTSNNSIHEGQAKMDHHIELLHAIVKDIDSMNSMTISVKQSTSEQLQAFEKFASQLRDVNAVALTIKESVEEQRKAIRDVTDAVTEINSVTQTYTITSDKLTLAAAENKRLAEELRGTIE